MDDTNPTVTTLRLRHPDLAFHVDVTLTEHQGRWLAVAMLADEPDIGTGTDPREAVTGPGRSWGHRTGSLSPETEGPGVSALGS